MRKYLLCPQSKYGKNQFATVGGHNIHYIEAGSGKPLLLIPGLFNTCSTWNRVIPFLSKEYMVIAIDYLGVGYSDKPLSGFSYTVQEQTDLVAKLIDKLPIRGTDVMGVSYGGIIVLTSLLDTQIWLGGSFVSKEKQRQSRQRFPGVR